jgi:hypothetical protein
VPSGLRGAGWLVKPRLKASMCRVRAGLRFPQPSLTRARRQEAKHLGEAGGAALGRVKDAPRLHPWEQHSSPVESRVRLRFVT